MSIKFKNKSFFLEAYDIIFKSIFLFSFFILPLVTCLLWGQVVQKKELTAADYPLWSTVNADKMAPNEKWISYRINYENGIDTLFVRSTITKKTYSFVAGKKSIFIKNNGFICETANGLQILNLESAQQQTMVGVKAYQYAEESDQLIMLYVTGAGKENLQIRFPFGNIQKEIPDVSQFSLSPNNTYLLYTTVANGKNAVFVTSLQQLENSKEIVSAVDGQYNNFTWHKQGDAIVFLGKTANATNNTLYYYNVETEMVYHFDPSNRSDFPANTDIVYNSIYKLLISDDLQKVFFTIQKKSVLSENKEQSQVEIWNANDKWIYPAEPHNGVESPKVALWKPLENSFVSITTTELPMMMLSGDQQNVILSNPKEYEPQFERFGPRDYYIQNLNTMEKKLLLQKHSGNLDNSIASPSGKYIAYFKDWNWWVYDIKLKRHTNITYNLKEKFFGKVGLLGAVSTFGNPGWSKDDTEILIYDQYDLWAIKPDGSSSRRLTHGRESKISFRMADIPNKYSLKKNYDGLANDCFDLEKELYLRAIGDDGKTGFYKWKKTTDEKVITYGDYYVDRLLYGSQKQLFCYRTQKFDQSPRLITSNKSSKENLLFQSNPQQEKYQWGKEFLIHFQNAKKEDLKGVLYFPANYDPKKKYPMIVHIYEVESTTFHKYYNPTLYTETGYNPTVFTSQGYFVLLPDIVHENKNVGPSSTDCVIAATNKVIQLGLVDPNKIGLMGHSFGGYETTFICNQTNLFATAIASGAITDLNSLYFTVSWNLSLPEMWRFSANEKWRMGTTPFEDPEGYSRNSPLASVEKLKTPLLLWTGKEDHHADWHQTIEYYLALRRLGKKNVTLLYPKEGHTILNPINQKDISERVLQWFGYFLKSEPPATWIRQGLQ